ncbi:MAG: DUF4159 domain-containing protein [Candidatus Omnitrophica bacterium]|nr:DUF4159 domain-containing protein [Candidatus Omnitrophota bacterium]
MRFFSRGLLIIASMIAAVAMAQEPQTIDLRVPKPSKDEPTVRCANLTYAGNMTSKCFSDKFLSTLLRETNIEPKESFDPIKLSSDELFKYPFAIMTGEGSFSLPETERINIRSYLERGGFILASAGCSSQEWDQSFRREIKRIFPNNELQKIGMDHMLFRTVFDIKDIKLKKSSGSAVLEGLEIDGRIVMIYSPEGLNDTSNVQGCCCCGGNEVKNSQEVNVNVITYSLTH